MIGLLFRILSRVAFRFLFTFLLFAIGNLLTGGRRRESSKGPRPSGGSRAGSRPPLNRGDAVDVPFTEVPHAGDAAPQSKPAGETGRGS
jgi:hypothetical protein